MKKQIFMILFSILILSSNIFARSAQELASIIASNSFSLTYYFFPSPQSQTYFLAKNRDAGASMWQFTNEQKWKPTHNAGAFDGFPEALEIFASLKLENGKVEIGSLTSNSDDALINELSGKTIDATHYFWVMRDSNANPYAFLARDRGEGGISIYYLTSEKKWQPVHNANAFDGFPSAGNTLDGVGIDLSIGYITTKAVITPSTGNDTITNSPEGEVANSGYNLVRTLEGHTSYIWSVDISKDGKYITSGSRDKSTKIWNVSNGKELANIRGHDDYVYSTAMSNNSRYIVSGSGDNNVNLHRAEKNSLTGKLDITLVSSLRGHSYGVNSIAITNDSQTIISGSDDKSIRIWDILGDKEPKILQGHSANVRSIAISSDDKYMVSAGDDEKIRVWDLLSNKTLYVLDGHRGGTITVDISKDGKYVVSGGSDNTVKIWDTTTKALLKTLEGHSAPIKSVSISNDVTRIVSGAMDATIKVWNLPEGELMGTITGHTSIVNAVDISDDNQYIISGSQDKTIKIWKMK